MSNVELKIQKILIDFVNSSQRIDEVSETKKDATRLYALLLKEYTKIIIAIFEKGR